jgi:hypothetical protein
MAGVSSPLAFSHSSFFFSFAARLPPPPPIANHAAPDHLAGEFVAPLDRGRGGGKELGGARAGAPHKSRLAASTPTDSLPNSLLSQQVATLLAAALTPAAAASAHGCAPPTPAGQLCCSFDGGETYRWGVQGPGAIGCHKM